VDLADFRFSDPCEKVMSFRFRDMVNFVHR
jgi:hypothetical protein